MPFALVTIGLLMIVTGINNTYSQFGSQLQSDFSGSKSFIVWVIALGAVGALGYIKDLRTFSHYFMALILIAMVLANKGVFQNFTSALASGPKAPTANASAASSTPTQTATVPPLTQSPTSGTSTDAQAAGNVAGQATNAITNGNDGGLFGSISKAFTEFLLNPTGQQ